MEIGEFKETLIIPKDRELKIKVEYDKESGLAILTIKEDSNVIYTQCQVANTDDIIASVGLDVYFGENSL